MNAKKRYVEPEAWQAPIPSSLCFLLWDLEVCWVSMSKPAVWPWERKGVRLPPLPYRPGSVSGCGPGCSRGSVRSAHSGAVGRRTWQPQRPVGDVGKGSGQEEVVSWA